MLKSVKAFVRWLFVNKFASQLRLITPSADTTMAVIRNTSSARRVGRVGNTTYYVANGQQIARQSRNDSNYGVDASRSRAQQMRRVRWSNLVNIYKACRTWMPKAFESKSRTQSDYNKFMSLNINTSSVCLTKDQATQGCAVMASYLVSQGSLPPIVYTGSGTQGSQIVTDIAVGSLSLTNAKINEVSNAIMENNPQFLNFDNIAIILFKTSEPKAGMPYTSTKYLELTIDKDNDTSFASHPLSSYVEIANNKLCVKASLFSTTDFQCIAMIHTRKVGGSLMTSTQQAFPNITDYWDEYSTLDQEERAIASYGVTEDVPLDPSFKPGSIISVSIDDVVSPSIHGSIVEHTGGCRLTVVGDNLTADNYELRFDNTVFTPLVEDGNSKTYILSSNGIARIYINGVLFGGIKVSGVVVSDDLTANKSACLVINASQTYTDGIYKLIVQGDCINYPRRVTASYPLLYLLLQSAGASISKDDFEVYNCEMTSYFFNEDNKYIAIRLTPTDASKVIYVEYKGSIVFVGNY